MCPTPACPGSWALSASGDMHSYLLWSVKSKEDFSSKEQVCMWCSSVIDFDLYNHEFKLKVTYPSTPVSWNFIIYEEVSLAVWLMYWFLLSLFGTWLNVVTALGFGKIPIWKCRQVSCKPFVMFDSPGVCGCVCMWVWASMCARLLLCLCAMCVHVRTHVLISTHKHTLGVKADASKR
jgi:hypothetical protein